MSTREFVVETVKESVDALAASRVVILLIGLSVGVVVSTSIARMLMNSVPDIEINDKFIERLRACEPEKEPKEDTVVAPLSRGEIVKV